MIRLAEHIKDKDNTHISSTRESHDKVVLKLLEVTSHLHKTHSTSWLYSLSQSSLSSTKLAPLHFPIFLSWYADMTMTYIFENKVKLPLKVPN